MDYTQLADFLKQIESLEHGSMLLLLGGIVFIAIIACIAISLLSRIGDIFGLMIFLLSFGKINQFEEVPGEKRKGIFIKKWLACLKSSLKIPPSKEK